MTEKKRFNLIEVNGNIEDGFTQSVYDGGEDVFELLDLLNGLNDDNEQLKKELEDALLDVKIYKNANATFGNVYDENEKLKSRINYLERKIERERNATNKQYEKWEKEALEKINKLEKENEQLKNKIDVLEDDNETYYKSLEKLNLYTKRFIPTKCTNEFKDCKTNRYYWLDHEGNFTGCLELLNLLDCEREVLESENRQLKGRLMAYEEQLKGDME